jgi:hypothetical protein
MAAGLLIWKLAARFGRPRPLILAKGRSLDEFVYSMAGLFQQAKIYQLVLENLWGDLIKLMAELTHLPVSAAPEQLIARMGSLTGADYHYLLEIRTDLDSQNRRSANNNNSGSLKKLNSILNAILCVISWNYFIGRMIGASIGGKVSKQRFLAIALKLDACRKELREWRKSNQFATR